MKSIEKNIFKREPYYNLFNKPINASETAMKR